MPREKKPYKKSRLRADAAARSAKRGKALRIGVSIQQSYEARIQKLVDKMIKETRGEIETHFRKDFMLAHSASDTPVMDESPDAQTRILVNGLKRKFDQIFGEHAMGISNEMADALNRHSFATVLSSLKDLPTLKDAGAKLTLDVKNLDKKTLAILKGSSARSADFIKTIPEHYLNRVSAKLYDSVTIGNGMQDLVPFFQKYDAGTRNWVHLTAMDQTRKTYNGLNIGRMKKVGIKKGEWIHSGGSQHPRPLHEDFDGKTFSLEEGAPVGDDDGNMVMPGDEPNCRCTFGPVIDDDTAGPESDETGDEAE